MCSRVLDIDWHAYTQTRGLQMSVLCVCLWITPMSKRRLLSQKEIDTRGVRTNYWNLRYRGSCTIMQNARALRFYYTSQRKWTNKLRGNLAENACWVIIPLQDSERLCKYFLWYSILFHYIAFASWLNTENVDQRFLIFNITIFPYDISTTDTQIFCMPVYHLH